MKIYKKELENKISIVWENDKECDYHIIRVYTIIDGRKVLMDEERKESNVRFYSIDKMGFELYIFEVESFKNKEIVEKNNTSIIETNKIYFGKYFINNDKTKEPIEWDILEEKDGKILIISHYVLDAIKFDEDYNNYEESHIRNWLNNDFYNNAFNDEVKSMIKTITIDNSSKSTGRYFFRSTSKNTKDKIFLLSLEEICKYFESIKGTKGTDYAKNRGLYVDKSTEFSCWWLRSPYNHDDFSYPQWPIYDTNERACFILNDSIDKFKVECAEIGVRPACWISLVETYNDEELVKEEVKEELKKESTQTNNSNNIIEISNNMDSSKEKEEVKTDQKSNTIFKREENVVTFGSYYINNDKTKEPIEWDILEEKDGNALIISHYILDVIKFDNKFNNYEKSYIRNWLNNDFYNIAFNDEEKEKIELTLVDNSAKSTGHEGNKYICNNTNDKIFLLSLKEAENYFKIDEEGSAKGTNYANLRGLSVNVTGYGAWWVRTPSYGNDYDGYCIAEDGFPLPYCEVSETGNGVRPACWIKLK